LPSGRENCVERLWVTITSISVKMEQRLKVSLLFFTLILSILIYSNHISGFNLDLNNYTVFSGPEDSYFGFSVDFYQSSSKR
uniref:Uncharacterized protein n=1 Tax=Sinocyclocheilus rhinocerous TaxID=307959 RepID=A0A673HLE8_9TELE